MLNKKSTNNSDSNVIRSKGSDFILKQLDVLDTMKLDSRQHASNVLNDLRLNNQLCDFRFKLPDGSESFFVHKAILSANSEYFRILFTNISWLGDNDKSVLVIDTSASTLKCLIGKFVGFKLKKQQKTQFLRKKNFTEWCYTKKTEITCRNVETLLPLADYYQILGLIDECSDFLKKKIVPENVIGFRKFAHHYCLSSLEKTAHNYLM
jgi:kelch-like protein 10